jgi:hypothetical protein
MPMTESISRSRKKECGAFFTPYWISSELIRHHNIHKRWADGATVLDPTAGDGSLLEALIRCTIEDKIPLTSSMLSRLKGFEREEDFTLNFRKRLEINYGILPPADVLECRDFLSVEPISYDILLGNPPWLNFTDVKEDEKEGLKKYFVHYGLTERGKGLLLGGSRIDLAALIIQKALHDHLVAGGDAYFFIPLSLMLNEGAHNVFRKGKLSAESDSFSFEEIRDFADIQVFPEVNTRCGFISIKKSIVQKSPVPYFTMIEQGKWKEDKACPVGKAGSAYMLTDNEKMPDLITIKPESRPRQGINTGGRNTLFIFDSCEDEADGLCRVQNKDITAILPLDLVFPLLNRKQFKGEKHPVKYIFLPYNRQSGRVLSLEELENYPAALEYLESQKESLTSRKGSLLGNSIKKGLYWILLGVGPYSFSTWKIVWEAYGRDEFKPMLFGNAETPGDPKPWIPNQALQASCSFESKVEALRVLKELQQPSINRILKRQNMEGTCNWAQPGRIRYFLKEI